jgi:hypothetical protein
MLFCYPELPGVPKSASSSTPAGPSVMPHDGYVSMVKCVSKIEILTLFLPGEVRARVKCGAPAAHFHGNGKRRAGLLTL